MTTKMPPGAPKLTIDGEVQSADDTLSDSEWEDLPEETEPQESLRRIARERK